MQEAELLSSFLDRALARKRSRYVGFLTTAKGRSKVLQALHHDLLDCFDERIVVERLPDEALEAHAIVFAPPSRFGANGRTLRDVLESHECSCLAVSVDGRYGVYRPETYLDAGLLLHPE